ncbi:MAG: class I SAM-dependent methyltransferase [Limisphaerales bacterium]
MYFILSTSLPSTPPDQTLEWVKALGPAVATLIAALFAVLGVCLTIWFSLRKGAVEARYTYAAKVLDLRLRQIGDFYAPLRMHLEQSRILYKKLLWSLDRLGKTNPDARIPLDGFRLLDHTYLILNDSKFCDVKPLVQSILDIGDKMSSIIAKHAGLIEGGMTETVIEYRAHLQMLKSSAIQKPPDGASEGWQKFGYYPRILNREVSDGYKEVLRHLEVYQEAGDEIIWKLLGRMHDSRREAFRNMLDNLSYYERNADAYAAKFDNFDLNDLRADFKIAVQKDAHAREALYGLGSPKLLEAGCGTGRDAAAFISDGFEVTAFDVSPAMVRKCNRRIRELKSSTDPQISDRAAKSSCDEKTFDEVRYRNEFDSVWASASLLHLPKRDLPDAVQRLVQSLKPDGVMFLSFKYGIGESEFDSRHYSYFRRRELETILLRIPGVFITDIWLTNRNGKRLSISAAFMEALSLAAQRKSGCWLNVLVKKTLR